MGRRGKSKKQSTNVETGSGEEENIPVRRRGRPQKPLKDEIDEEEVEKKILKLGEEESESGKSSVSSKDMKKQSVVIENGRKRKKKPSSQAKEIQDSIEDENNGIVGSKTDGLKAVGFRQNGSRRKNKPRRAAEVGVECK